MGFTPFCQIAGTAASASIGEGGGIEWENIEEMKRAVLSETRENRPLHWADSASLHSGIYRLSVGFSCCRLLALPEMAYRHPLLKPFYGGLQGRFPCFAPISYHSPQKSSNLRAIYQVGATIAGKPENQQSCQFPWLGPHAKMPLILLSAKARLAAIEQAMFPGRGQRIQT